MQHKICDKKENLVLKETVSTGFDWCHSPQKYSKANHEKLKEKLYFEGVQWYVYTSKCWF